MQVITVFRYPPLQLIRRSWPLDEICFEQLQYSMHIVFITYRLIYWTERYINPLKKVRSSATGGNGVILGLVGTGWGLLSFKLIGLNSTSCNPKTSTWCCPLLLCRLCCCHLLLSMMNPALVITAALFFLSHICSSLLPPLILFSSLLLHLVHLVI